MALTSTEKNKIVQLLGYTGKTLQPGSVIYNKILNDRLDNMLQDSEDLVRSYLAQIAALEAQIFSAPARLQAEKIDGIVVNRRELEDLRKERKKIAREIADHVDIPYMGRGPNVSRVV